MPTPFRCHHEPPTSSSTVYRPLLAEWVTLQNLPSTRLQLRRWARTHPILTGYTTPGDLIDAIDAADQDIAEQHLIALVRVHQTGNQLAGRILLQAMLPALHRIAAGRTLDDQHAVLAEFWIALSKLRITDTTTRIAASLKLNALRGVTKNRLTDDHSDPYPDPTQDVRDHQSPTLTAEEPDPDLADVITWAQRTNAITTSDAHLLTLAYLTEGTTITDLATHLGISTDAAKKRRTRAREKLVDAVRAQLAHDNDDLQLTQVA